MRIVTLLENSSINPELKQKHGISLYIETENRKILFDAGPGEEFKENAGNLQVDLSAVDLMVLSHGHYDHGGGLPAFLKMNQHARVILKDSAVNNFYFKTLVIIKVNIGLKLSESDQERLELISENLKVDDSIQIFTGFNKSGFIPGGNMSLYTKNKSGKTVNDPFDHEICLLIKSKGKNVLFTGCSHSGIGNMMRTVKKAAGIESFDTVIGGFHLYNPTSKKTESKDKIDNLITELNEFPDTKFYTGHCTGKEAYQYLNSVMGDRVSEFKTGMEINI